MTKRQIKPQDKLIADIYAEFCSGMRISVMRIPDIYAQARRKLDHGATRDELGSWMVDYVRTWGEK